MDKLLCFNNSYEGTALVLATNSSAGAAIITDCGHDIENWPSDLGIYDKGTGFFIWEGKITEEESDTTLEGELSEIKSIKDAQEFLKEFM